MADGIILYDRAGNPLEFHDKKVLRVDTTDGGTKDFVGATLVEKTVELDFSDGDMKIEPGADELFSEVTIPVPSGLIPGHIAEGVTIAGIVGEFVGSSAGAKVSRTYTTITGTYNSRVDVDFGFRPDFLLVYPGANSVSAKSKGVMLAGNTTQMAEKMGIAQFNARMSAGSTAGSMSMTSVTISIDSDVSANVATAPICGCDETGFTIGRAAMFSGGAYIVAMKLT